MLITKLNITFHCLTSTLINILSFILFLIHLLPSPCHSSEKNIELLWHIYHLILIMSLAAGQKDCDLPKSAITSLHGANTFGQLQNSSSSDSNGGRLHVSGGLCDPHNMHQDHVCINRSDGGPTGSPQLPQLIQIGIIILLI